MSKARADAIFGAMVALQVNDRLNKGGGATGPSLMAVFIEEADAVVENYYEALGVSPTGLTCEDFIHGAAVSEATPRCPECGYPAVPKRG